MSPKSSKNNEQWPRINAMVALNPGTRLDCGENKVAIVPQYEEEVIGIVISHSPAFDWRFDSLEVMVEDQIYRVLRTPGSTLSEPPYFNLRQYNDDGTTEQF